MQTPVIQNSIFFLLSKRLGSKYCTLNLKSHSCIVKKNGGSVGLSFYRCSAPT
jgi:hypothetical protein